MLFRVFRYYSFFFFSFIRESREYWSFCLCFGYFGVFFRFLVVCCGGGVGGRDRFFVIWRVAWYWGVVLGLDSYGFFL